MMVKGMPLISKVWPTAASELPKRSRANFSVTTAHLMWAMSSVSSRKRPSGTTRLRMSLVLRAHAQHQRVLHHAAAKADGVCISRTGEEYITPGTCASTAFSSSRVR